MMNHIYLNMMLLVGFQVLHIVVSTKKLRKHENKLVDIYLQQTGDASKIKSEFCFINKLRVE